MCCGSEHDGGNLDREHDVIGVVVWYRAGLLEQAYCPDGEQRAERQRGNSERAGSPGGPHAPRRDRRDGE